MKYAPAVETWIKLFTLCIYEIFHFILVIDRTNQKWCPIYQKYARMLNETWHCTSPIEFHNLNNMIVSAMSRTYDLYNTSFSVLSSKPAGPRGGVRPTPPKHRSLKMIDDWYDWFYCRYKDYILWIDYIYGSNGRNCVGFLVKKHRNLRNFRTFWDRETSSDVNSEHITAWTPIVYAPTEEYKKGWNRGLLPIFIICSLRVNNPVRVAN